MSQHQQTFSADNLSDAVLAEHKILSVLADSCLDGRKAVAEFEGQSSQIVLECLQDRLFRASYCQDPTVFLTLLKEVKRLDNSNFPLTLTSIQIIARRLGAAWMDDAISFSDVTVGCARLQLAVRQTPDTLRCKTVNYGGVQRACLILVRKGVQHTLGALVLAKQLRQAGQRVVVELQADEDVLKKLSNQEQFDVIMISASDGECRNELRSTVNKCRQFWSSSNIVVGGSIVEFNKDIVCSVNADHATNEWQEALDICN